jgi:branched-chain amino acid aminotransferase
VTEALSTIWVNGERLPFDARHVSARDRGLTLADGVFETMRAHGGTVFRLDRHLARLAHALGVLRIPEPPEARDWVMAAVRAADLREAAVRLTVTRGIGPAGVAPPEDVQPTAVVAVNPIPPFPQSIYETGLRASVASGRRNEYAMTAGLKTVAYTDNIAALLEARRGGADEALFLDVDGHCCEATASNLFMWRDGRLTTPPRSCGVLPGITREAVLELARKSGLPTVEQPFGLDELMRADEAFLTSSLRGIAPLVRIDEHPLGNGVPGPITRRLAAAYTDLIARECGA